MSTERQRDRHITRQVHRLFWQGNLANKRTFFVWMLTRPAAIFIYNILIPIQLAYGLQAILTRHFDLVGHYALMIIVLALAYCVLWAIGGQAICRNGVIGAAFVQRKVFANYLQKDYEFYNSTYLGALSSQAVRLRDSFNEYNQIVLNMAPIQVIVVVSTITVIAYNSLPLALVTLVGIGLVLGFTILSSRWRLRYRRQLGEASSVLAGVVGDALGQATVVKSFASEPYEEERLATSVEAWADSQYKSWLSSIPSDLGRMFLAAAAMAAILLTTAHLYQSRAISIAIVALVQLYVIRLVTMTQSIADSIKGLEASVGGAYQSIVTMLVKSAVADPLEPKRYTAKASNSIVFNEAGFHYADAAKGKYAISKFSLSVAEGEKIGVVGYSGSGKTTLTKLLMRFMDLTDGSIEIAGQSIDQVRQADLRAKIAYVPQEPLLFHRSISENIAYGRPSASHKEIMSAAKAAYVDEFVDDLPEKYNTKVGERGVKLSGGQRQRVAIARALLKEAPILVLDEATSALDSRSEKLIQQALWKLMKGRTALVIAHRLSTIQRMDRIVVMDKGRIVQIGTHEELLKDKKGIYAELWSHQSGGYLGGVPEIAA